MIYRHLFLAVALAPSALGLAPITDDNIHAAVRSWCANSTTAAATYGPIGDWDTSNVSNMSYLFYGDHTIPGKYVPGAENFNDDISRWDTANVESMLSTFNFAASFDVNISPWNVGRVTTMDHMFAYASVFNQP